MSTPPRPRTPGTATADADGVRGSVLRLAERFRPEQARGLDAVWVVDVTGHTAFTIHVRDRRCLVAAGAADRWDVRLTLDARAWLDLVAGRCDGLRAFMTGRLSVSGDLHLALRLETVFGPGPEATRIVRVTRTRVRGVEVEAVVAGHGTPLVLLHGLAANKLSFAPTLDGLADRYELHALDLPGFGRSDKPLPHGRRYSPAWMADIVHGYLVRNGISAAYLVGNSMGGRIATEVALRHPRSVHGIVGLGSAVAFDEWQRLAPLLRAVQTQWIGLAAVPLRLDWLERTMGELLFADPSRIPTANMRAGAEDVLGSFAERGYRLAVAAASRQLACDRALGRRGYWRRLARLELPSHWIWGRDDRLVRCSYAERVREAVPSATVEVWDGVGHVPQFEVPERTNAAIHGFVQRVEAGG